MARGNIEAKNKAKQVQARASKVKVSFLNSGLTLAGTPISAIESIFDVGLEDINLISKNANTQSKNIISKARNDAILSLATAAVGGIGGAGGFEGADRAIGNASGFQGGLGGFGGIPFGGFEGATGVPFQDPSGPVSRSI